MKKLTIVLIALLLCVSVLAACTPGVLMDWIANIGSGSATPGNAVSYGNSLPFVSFGGAEFATAGNVVSMGNATSGNATPGNAGLTSAGNAGLTTAGNAQ